MRTAGRRGGKHLFLPDFCPKLSFRVRWCSQQWVLPWKYCIIWCDSLGIVYTEHTYTCAWGHAFHESQCGYVFIGKLDTHLLVIHMNALGLIPCHHVMNRIWWMWLSWVDYLRNIVAKQLTFIKTTHIVHLVDWELLWESCSLSGIYLWFMPHFFTLPSSLCAS